MSTTYPTIDWKSLPNGGLDFKLEPGIYINVPYAVYSSWEACSRSALEIIHRKSPAHAKWKDDHPDEETPAMLIGRAVHCLTLEGQETFDNEFVVSETCFAVKGKGDACENPGIVRIDGHWYCGVHSKGRLHHSICELVNKYTAEGYATEKISAAGSYYLKHSKTGRLLRISDHPPGAVSFQRLQRDRRQDIRADLPPYGNNENRSILKPDQLKQVLGMVAALPLFVPEAHQFIYQEPGTNEVCLVWVDPETGILCKGRADMLRPHIGYAGDIKTCICASADKFADCIKDYGYGRQARFYLDGCWELGLEITKFALIPMEKEQPYCPNLFRLGDATLEAAAADLYRAKRIYAKCKQTGVWPGYEGDQYIDVPRYELRRAMEQVQTF